MVVVNADRDLRDGAAAKAVGSNFPRARRLLSPAQFSAVLSGPLALRASAFALHVVERTTPGALPADVSADLSAIAPDTATGWRLGLVIPKRFEASAARRNAIKRRWREAFRLRAASLEAQLPASDLVVRMTVRLSTPKRPAPSRQGSAIQAIDATLMIDQMAARISSRALANRSPR